MAKIKTKGSTVLQAKTNKSKLNKVVKQKRKRLPKKSIGPSKAERFTKRERGAVYVSHLPHGFYEDQLQNYFNQFGHITNVSVPRSKSGKARGYAFVEFKHPEVGKIAAETMNNYLMFNRVVKAKYLEPTEQKPHAFRRANINLASRNTLKDKAQRSVEAARKQKNRKLKPTDEAKLIVKLARKFRSHQKRAKALDKDSEVEINVGDAETILKRAEEIFEKHRKAKEEAEKIQQIQEAKEEAAKETAEKDTKTANEEKLEIKEEKKMEKKKQKRVSKKLKQKNSNVKEEKDAKINVLQSVIKKKRGKKNLRKKVLENHQSTDDSTKTQTQEQEKNIVIKQENHTTNANKPIIQSVGIKSKKNRPKRKRTIAIKDNNVTPALLVQHTSEVNKADLQGNKTYQPQAGKQKEIVQTNPSPNQKKSLAFKTSPIAKQSKNSIKKAKLSAKLEKLEKIASKKDLKDKKTLRDPAISKSSSTENPNAVLKKKQRHRNRPTSENVIKKPKIENSFPSESANRSTSKNSIKKRKIEKSILSVSEKSADALVKSPKKQKLRRSRKGNE